MLQEIFTFLNQKAISTIIVASISTIIVACGGIVAVMLTHYWTTKREIRASHRLRQSEVYKDFRGKHNREINARGSRRTDSTTNY